MAAGKNETPSGSEFSGVSSATGFWPAGPGEEQYEWEAPRKTQPLLGCTINGYNHRADLLRGYGNAVVEQTAALAWRILWRKFGIDFGEII